MKGISEACYYYWRKKYINKSEPSNEPQAEKFRLLKLEEDQNDIGLFAALAEMHKLYAIEEVCREQKLNIAQIKEKRNMEAVPILQQLGKWMKSEYEKLRPKTPIAQDFAYSIKRWEGLSLYATTGNLHIDNNAIERCMRAIAIGRKNYLFCGSHDAVKRSGRLYSLLVTCKLNEINPYDWLKDVISQNIQEMHINKIKDLLPHNQFKILHSYRKTLTVLTKKQ